MASSGKRKTTMAKLNRERRLLERRLEKQAKEGREEASVGTSPRPAQRHADRQPPVSQPRPGAGQPALAAVVQALADA
jgi:hypothetical protein